MFGLQQPQQNLGRSWGRWRVEGRIREGGRGGLFKGSSLLLFLLGCIRASIHRSGAENASSQLHDPPLIQGDLRIEEGFRCSFPIGTFRICLDIIYIQILSRIYLDFIQSSPSFDLDLEFLQNLSRVPLVLLSRSRIDLDLIYNSASFPPQKAPR